MTADNAHECIYCRRWLPSADFTREHVLSQAFGKFEDAPVPHNMVCGECNQFFGDFLEMRVARGSFEGMLRYTRGTKTPDAGLLRLPCVEFAIPHEGSDWSGVRLHLAWQEGRVVVELVNQVALFDRRASRWVHFFDSEIEAGVLSEIPTLETTTGRIYARSPEGRDGLLRLLEKNGITFKTLNDLSPPPGTIEGEEIPVEVTFTVDKGIRRCMAKYAFNFLAFVCGPGFVLERDFDAIRRYIRFGEMQSYRLVGETDQPILGDDSASRRQTTGHLLTVDWAISQVDLVGQVSLFNSVTYLVSLARRYSGLVWRPIREGLHFNLAKRTVEPLRPVSAIVVP